MKENQTQAIVVAVHWSSFGGYHIARLNSAFHEMKQYNIVVVGLEISTHKKLLGWKPDYQPTVFPRYVVFPEQTFEEISRFKMWSGVMSTLYKINPSVVAINGYSYYDAWSALMWCKINQRPAILMGDSKIDDAKRTIWKEWIKKQITRQYSAGLCAGKYSKDYLLHLQMKPEKIVKGIDVVDNDYFWIMAEKVRGNPGYYRSFPGLELTEPFFLASARLIKDKNIDGLLKAYSKYRYQFLSLKMGRTPWRLVILGDGPERNALLQVVKSESIQGVSFAGFRQYQELPVYLALAGVFVHPTFKDTWGLVVNEAMAVGLPVLVSDRAGCAPDLVREGHNGYLFSPDDSNQLANYMLLMSSQQVDLKSMGEASRTIISEWGPKRFAQSLAQAVQTVVNRNC